MQLSRLEHSCRSVAVAVRQAEVERKVHSELMFDVMPP